MTCCAKITCRLPPPFTYHHKHQHRKQLESSKKQTKNSNECCFTVIVFFYLPFCSFVDVASTFAVFPTINVFSAYQISMYLSFICFIGDVSRLFLAVFLCVCSFGDSQVGHIVSASLHTIDGEHMSGLETLWEKRRKRYFCSSLTNDGMRSV